LLPVDTETVVAAPSETKRGQDTLVSLDP